MAEILSFDKKEKKARFKVQVDLKDGSTYNISCSYFGFDIPGYLAFIMRDVGGEEMSWPDYFINEDLIQTISITEETAVETNTN